MQSGWFYYRNFIRLSISGRLHMSLHFFHIRTVHLDIIKVLFIHQLAHQWVVLKKQY